MLDRAGLQLFSSLLYSCIQPLCFIEQIFYITWHKICRFHKIHNRPQSKEEGDCIVSSNQMIKWPETLTGGPHQVETSVQGK